MNNEKNKIIKASLLVVFLFALFLFLHFSGIHDRFLTFEIIKNYISSAGIWAPLFFIGLYGLPIFSDSLIAMAGGAIFGPVFGTLYSVIGAGISTTISFLIARYLGRDFLAAHVKGGWKLFDDDIGKHGFLIILIMRLVPIFPYEGINYGAGLTKIRFRDYFLGTILGIIPAAFAYNFFGNFLANLIDPFYIIPIYIILFIIIGPLVINHYKKKTKNATK